jgi:hypothetical protein
VVAIIPLTKEEPMTPGSFYHAGAPTSFYHALAPAPGAIAGPAILAVAAALLLAVIVATGVARHRGATIRE